MIDELDEKPRGGRSMANEEVMDFAFPLARKSSIYGRQGGGCDGEGGETDGPFFLSVFVD